DAGAAEVPVLHAASVPPPPSMVGAAVQPRLPQRERSARRRRSRLDSRSYRGCGAPAKIAAGQPLLPWMRRAGEDRGWTAAPTVGAPAPAKIAAGQPLLTWVRPRRRSSRLYSSYYLGYDAPAKR